MKKNCYLFYNFLKNYNPKSILVDYKRTGSFIINIYLVSNSYEYLLKTNFDKNKNILSVEIISTNDSKIILKTKYRGIDKNSLSDLSKIFHSFTFYPVVAESVRLSYFELFNILLKSYLLNKGNSGFLITTDFISPVKVKDKFTSKVHLYKFSTLENDNIIVNSEGSFYNLNNNKDLFSYIVKGSLEEREIRTKVKPKKEQWLTIERGSYSNLKGSFCTDTDEVFEYNLEVENNRCFTLETVFEGYEYSLFRLDDCILYLDNFSVRNYCIYDLKSFIENVKDFSDAASVMYAAFDDTKVIHTEDSISIDYLKNIVKSSNLTDKELEVLKDTIRNYNDEIEF